MSALNYLITGAASGMGAAAAEIVVKEGGSAILCDIDTRGLKATAARLPSQRTHIHELDITDREAVHEVFRLGASELQSIDAVLHFAGILDSRALADIRRDNLVKVLDINLCGSIWVAQACAEVMGSSGGCLILTASDSARGGSLVSGPAYSASKGAIVSLTRNLAIALGPLGIRVNAISPGLALTGMSADWDPVVLENYRARSPIGKIGTAADMASAAFALSSSAMAHVNGEILEVNGGTFFD